MQSVFKFNEALTPFVSVGCDIGRIAGFNPIQPYTSFRQC